MFSSFVLRLGSSSDTLVRMDRQDEQLLFTAQARILDKLCILAGRRKEDTELIERLTYAGDASERRNWNIEVAAQTVEHMDKKDSIGE